MHAVLLLLVVNVRLFFFVPSYVILSVASVTFHIMYFTVYIRLKGYVSKFFSSDQYSELSIIADKMSEKFLNKTYNCNDHPLRVLFQIRNPTPRNCLTLKAHLRKRRGYINLLFVSVANRDSTGLFVTFSNSLGCIHCRHYRINKATGFLDFWFFEQSERPTERLG